MMFLATAEAARCEWMATGDTADQAKKNLVRAFWNEWANDPFPPVLANHSVAAFDDWYSIRVIDLADGVAFCDGTVVK